MPGRYILSIVVRSCLAMLHNLIANEELLSSEEEEVQEYHPVQDNRISSSTHFYSGRRSAVPLMRSECFSCLYKDKVFIESTAVFSLSEYNFGSLFEDYSNVCLEFKLPLYHLFSKLLQQKWPDVEFECERNIYRHKGIAIIDFPNLDYWPVLLAWFAQQCFANGIKFFENCKIHDEFEGENYGNIFA